jgi:hypothetical protein
MNIPEDFLHYLWKYALYETDELLTESGENVRVMNAGQHNKDAGPDFLNAKIQIGEQIWAGNIEIHRKASDWHKHGHYKDKAYNNVILHVTTDSDAETHTESGRKLAVAELKFNPKLFNNYKEYLDSSQRPMCRNDLKLIDSFTLNNWLEVLLFERFERKTEDFRRLLNYTDNHWEEAFYIFLASAFGAKVNAAAFELTAKSLPSIILGKHKNNLFQIEALLLGQAGLLQSIQSDEDYPAALKKEYDFLRKKFKLKPVEGHLWKYLRIRPANFPDIRIAQFALLVHRSVHLFSKILEARNVKELQRMFDITLSDYWDTHYRIGKESPRRIKRFGKQAQTSVIINTLIPVLFFYGKQKALPEYQERAVEFLEALPPESNRIIRQWKEAGISAKNAAQSQALLQLHKVYCSPKRCLDCRIGNQLIINR